MSAQMLWVILGVFVLGLFIGTNLGVMLLCLLQMSASSNLRNGELTPLPVQVDS